MSNVSVGTSALLGGSDLRFDLGEQELDLALRSRLGRHRFEVASDFRNQVF
jgi:hypothetical protein